MVYCSIWASKRVHPKELPKGRLIPFDRSMSRISESSNQISDVRIWFYHLCQHRNSFSASQLTEPKNNWNLFHSSHHWRIMSSDMPFARSTCAQLLNACSVPDLCHWAVLCVKWFVEKCPGVTVPLCHVWHRLANKMSVMFNWAVEL